MKFSASSLFAVFLLPSLILSSPILERQTTNGSLDPNDDPFYTPDSAIPSTKGTILKKRSIQSTIVSPFLDQSYQVLYSTTNTSLQNEATVATIFTPKSPASPPRILSYQAYEDAVQLDCAPSWAFVQASPSANKVIVVLDTPFYIEFALASGYYVVVSDNYGPKSAFIAGHQEGMAVLDGVRAIINSEKLSNSQVALLGYSGGASSTVWASNLASTYGKELNIVGAMYGGTPVSTKDTFNFLNGKSIFAGFAGAGALGLGAAYPDLQALLDAKITAAGKSQIGKFYSRGYCLASVAVGSPFVNFLDYFTENVLQDPITQRILAKETLLKTESSEKIYVPKFPRYITHGLEDEIIPYVPVTQYVAEQCASGANIAFVTFPISEHVTTEILSVVPFIQFLQQSFSGTTPKVLCGTALPAPAINSATAVKLIGQDNVNKLLSLNGTSTPFGSINCKARIAGRLSFAS